MPERTVRAWPNSQHKCPKLQQVGVSCQEGGALGLGVQWGGRGVSPGHTCQPGCPALSPCTLGGL